MHKFVMTLALIALLAVALTGCGKAVDYSADPAFIEGRAACETFLATGQHVEYDFSNPAANAGWNTCMQQANQ